LRPNGAFFFGFTFNQFLLGFLYGLWFYKRRPRPALAVGACLTVTLLINFLGSVAIGAIVETSELAAGALSREAVLFLKVGLCGGFTTFSTFSLETLELIEGGQYAIAGAYALVSVVLCVAGVLVGKVLARALMPTG